MATLCTLRGVSDPSLVEPEIAAMEVTCRHIYCISTYLHNAPALGDFISCFADVAGLEETRCMFSEGYSTCYTQYDRGGYCP